MRAIGFRGKRIDNREWVYGNLMQFEDSALLSFLQMNEKVLAH